MKVEFRNVTGRRKGFHLVNLNLEIKEGYLTGLVGKNGAGKTTLFHYLTDSDVKYEGEILIDGDKDALKSGAVKNRIGFVAEEQQFIMNKSAAENAKLFGTLYDVFRIEAFRQRMEQMKVPQARLLSQMSRGEYLKFQLAFAIAHETKLYLLDEVTAGMDPVFRKDLFRILHELLLTEDVSILMSSHLEDEVAQHMDYVGVLEEGALISFSEVIQ